jgi:CRP/FNR family transcriptional regulator, cyclic AMP receptor protein
MSTNIGMLAEVPVFSLLDAQERATLAELLETEHFKEGDYIFHLGDAGHSLYIVLNGRVQVYVENTEGDKIVLAENEPGDVFGEISLLDGGPRTATAIAIENTELLRLDRESLQELVTTHPHAALDLLTVMGRRLRSTDELLRSHVSRNANEEEEERMTLGQRIADRVASFGGSWTFIIIFLAGMIAWMTINSVVLHRAFDPYPFILLNLVLSCLAALQAPVIMMSQNRQSSKDRLKSDLDYQVNMKAELEVAHLHRKMDRVYEIIQAHWAEREQEKKTENKGKPANDYY